MAAANSILFVVANKILNNDMVTDSPLLIYLNALSTAKVELTRILFYRLTYLQNRFRTETNQIIFICVTLL